jgi:hypothetical protein
MPAAFPDVPQLARTSITSPPLSRRGTTNSTSEQTSSHKHHRPHVHRHRTRDKDKGKDHRKSHDENPIRIVNSNLQPAIAVTGVEPASSRSENVTPAQSQNASRRTSLLGLNSDLDGSAAGWRGEGKGSKEAELADEKEKGALRAAFVIPFQFLYIPLSRMYFSIR